MSYSQPISKLAGFSDRTGEQSSNGRDIGLQIQGDFLKNQAGRNLLHYQIGVFNGEGMNQKDRDNRKDIEEIPEIYLRGVQFHYVENIQDVWNFALTDEMVANPIEFKIEEDKK